MVSLKNEWVGGIDMSREKVNGSHCGRGKKKEWGGEQEVMDQKKKK